MKLSGLDTQHLVLSLLHFFASEVRCFFLNKKKRKTIKGADNFVSQYPHQSLLSPEALLQQYFGRQLSYRRYLCSRVCIQVWVYAHARACVGSFEAPAQVYDIKRVAWRSPCLLVSQSGRAGVELWRLPCFTVRSGSFRSCEGMYESVAHLNYWRCPSLYYEIGTWFAETGWFNCEMPEWFPFTGLTAAQPALNQFQTSCHWFF